MGQIVYTSVGAYPGHRLKGAERYARLYHYTTFESFVKIWLSKTLKFSSVKNVNDVLESNLRTQASNFDRWPIMEAYLDIRPKYKQISLTMDYDSYIKGCMSPCMWGYYADKTNGVCIELDYNKLVFNRNIIKGPITYKKDISYATELPADVITINQLKRYLHKNAKSIFLTKHISWKGENEYRIISYEDQFLDISNAIIAIHLTSFESEECLYVEKLVNGEIPVKYLHYISTPGQGKALPVMTETNTIREQYEKAAKNKDNVIPKIKEQAKEFYLLHKHDLDTPLIKNQYIL